jgi:hypothetical protein
VSIKTAGDIQERKTAIHGERHDGDTPGSLCVADILDCVQSKWKSGTMDGRCAPNHAPMRCTGPAMAHGDQRVIHLADPEKSPCTLATKRALIVHNQRRKLAQVLLD